MNRTARVERSTKESQVLVEVDLDGSGTSEIETGVPFFDHMLAQLAKHGGLDLVVRTTGDLAVDAHHTVEDTSLALGQAINEALGDRSGLRRFGDALVPLDECLVQSAVDLSGRPYLVHEEPDGTVVLEPAVVMSELERRFLENAALQASIEYARAHPEQRVGRRPRP